MVIYGLGDVVRRPVKGGKKGDKKGKNQAWHDQQDAGCSIY
jgi:hypothetical protein